MNKIKELNVFSEKLQIFSGNALKIIALIAMTCDHIGYYLSDNMIILRIVGRIAFPIFAYMISEGCKYTKNRKKYLLTILLSGLLFQIIYTGFSKSLYCNIFITFSLSIILIYLFDWAKGIKKKSAYTVPLLMTISFFLIAEILPLYSEHGFKTDYGFTGLFIPVLLYFIKDKKIKLFVLSIMLVILSFSLGKIELFSLICVPLLALYNNKRGKLNLKYFFYLYYPLHLLVIFAINELTKII